MPSNPATRGNGCYYHQVGLDFARDFWAGAANGRKPRALVPRVAGVTSTFYVWRNMDKRQNLKSNWSNREILLQPISMVLHDLQWKPTFMNSSFLSMATSDVTNMFVRFLNRFIGR